MKAENQQPPTNGQSSAPDRRQELFLPVHGYIWLFPEELAIVDHPAFQRLRRLRQMGFAHVVFPGATHTRFEHSLGAMHMAQRIVDSVNESYNRASDADYSVADGSSWLIKSIDGTVARLIRLGALLHDIGHIPYGHTLEDELGHLNKHDGVMRLTRIAERRFPEYVVNTKALDASTQVPGDGWSLQALVDVLYQKVVQSLGLPHSPFRVLSHIICKPPKSDSGEWKRDAAAISARIPLDVCRDIVGDTICADFLDYIARDWHHIGKPFTIDTRLFHYMEVREPARHAESDKPARPMFLINVGAGAKVRHDALTIILDLLQSRYKLSETVIFHRTKLAMIGTLDRCMLELRALYKEVQLDIPTDLVKAAEDILLDRSDDALAEVLMTLNEGLSGSARSKIAQAVGAEQVLPPPEDAAPSVQAGLTFGTPRLQGPIKQRQMLIERLITAIKSRHVYTLAFKLRMSDFPGNHSPSNPHLQQVIAMYAVPEHRQSFLHGVEVMLGAPPGSLVMYVPHDGEMNAKVAKVNVYVEGDVSEFTAYEERQRDASLTRGALSAQVNRFYELWAAHVFVEAGLWSRLTEDQREHFQTVIERCFAPCKKPQVARTALQGSVDAVRLLAARAATTDSRSEKLAGFVFPNGMPFTMSAKD